VGHARWLGEDLDPGDPTLDADVADLDAGYQAGE
jgi:hypothetical protein